MTRPFIFFSNTFESVTRTSYPRMLTISSYTYSALNGPDGIPTLFTFYKPLHETYVARFNEWKAQRTKQKGKTASLNDLFDAMTPNVAQWDLDIQRVYAKGTPEYIAIMGRNRKPFTQGTQDERINAVTQLGLAIGTDPLLTAVKTGVDTYYTAILALNSAQKSDKVLTDTKSQELEAARIAASEGLYYVLGSLMMTYHMTPPDIEKFFRMDLLRRMPQKNFTGRVPPQTTKEILKRKLKPTDTMTVTNMGLVTIELYLAPTKAGPAPAGTTPLSIAPGISMHVAATQLGNVENRYLNVRNSSTVAEAEWELAM